MTAAENPIHLILIGDELLSGKRQDLHLRRVASDLTRLGARVETCEVIRDEPGAVADAVRRRLAPGAIILTTGGLGPTLDDLTREGISEATGVGLREESEIWEDLKQRFERAGRKISESNRSQALVPEKGVYFINVNGTAPGLVFEPPGLEGCRVVALPGPPRELVPMWDNQVLPYLREVYAWPPCPYAVLMRFVLVGESNIDEKMRPLLAPYPEISLSSLIRIARVDVTLSVAREDARGQERLHSVVSETQALFGEFLYETLALSEDSDSPPREFEQVIADLLRQRGETAALAESCTGGLVSKYLTDFAGSSDVFKGGVVSYHNDLKRDLLGVPEAVLSAHGAVSEETAKAMALGVAARTGAEWGLAITGIAGPGGGTEAKPIGLVWIALAGKGEVATRRYEFPGDREWVRERAAVAALRLLWLSLKG